METVKQINIKKRTYYFYNDIIDLENFDSTLLNQIKNHIKTLVFTTLDISQLKTFVIVKIFTVLILCIYVLPMQMDILNK